MAFAVQKQWKGIFSLVPREQHDFVVQKSDVRSLLGYGDMPRALASFFDFSRLRR